jgi:hypothetical protein
MCYIPSMSRTTTPPAKPPSRRSLTSVDLGELRAAVHAASAAAGVGPSTWLRDLVRQELTKTPAAAPPSTPGPPADDRTADDRTAVYRAWLDATATGKLDRITEAGGFRNRAAALRALLDGVNLSATGSVSSAGQVGPAGIAEAVQALGESNHHLVAIARQLRDLAKTIEGGDKAKLTAAVGAELGQAVQQTRQHLKVAAVLVGELRPMLKTQKREP